MSTKAQKDHERRRMISARKKYDNRRPQNNRNESPPVESPRTCTSNQVDTSEWEKMWKSLVPVEEIK